MDFLPILGVETSGENCGVSLYFNEKKFTEINFHEKNIHSEILFDLIDDLLKLSGTDLSEVSAIAVSIGPGSFTGLRIGLAAAKGLAVGASLPIIPVPTFKALAMQIGENLEYERQFAIIKKASINDFYYARFVNGKEEIKEVDETKLIRQDEMNFSDEDILVYSDVNFDFAFRKVPEIRAASISKWAYFFGKDLLTYNFDFLEPEYLKKFIPKVKK